MHTALINVFAFLCNQNVIIKLADFGFAKIDRGDLVTPQFTPYYVSPQVLIGFKSLQYNFLFERMYF